MLKENDIKDALQKVIDPELNIDIVRLGLIRSIEIGEYFEELNMHEYIKIIMTFTSPMCPFVDSILQDVEDNINILGKGQAEVEVTFDPPWECPEDLKLELGL
jgi:metal-sulfur cluster biosynthetic enzyme